MTNPTPEELVEGAIYAYRVNRGPILGVLSYALVVAVFCGGMTLLTDLALRIQGHHPAPMCTTVKQCDRWEKATLKDLPPATGSSRVTPFNPNVSTTPAPKPSYIPGGFNP